jgi:hypothetical protein
MHTRAPGGAGRGAGRFGSVGGGPTLPNRRFEPGKTRCAFARAVRVHARRARAARTPRARTGTAPRAGPVRAVARVAMIGPRLRKKKYLFSNKSGDDVSDILVFNSHAL